MRTWLKEARESLGLTQQQLASLVGKDITTIGKYENGKRRPSYETAKKISSILSIDWTLFYEEKGA